MEGKKRGEIERIEDGKRGWQRAVASYLRVGDKRARLNRRLRVSGKERERKRGRRWIAEIGREKEKAKEKEEKEG